ncbi:hypothetical protein BDW59DRAFT_145775 [Aspergillus cavernicola]|uniref:Ankyrin repeat-containing domain protein n=1 Tax=Aspergillus cavernicola TaxID=176166 RepID=A0ABR4IFQ6_9EURO
MLIENGAPVDSKRADGATPIRIASLSGKINTVRLLLENGADLVWHCALCCDHFG